MDEEKIGPEKEMRRMLQHLKDDALEMESEENLMKMEDFFQELLENYREELIATVKRMKKAEEQLDTIQKIRSFIIADQLSKT